MTRTEKLSEISKAIDGIFDMLEDLGDLGNIETEDMSDLLYESLGDAQHLALRLTRLVRQQEGDKKC